MLFYKFNSDSTRSMEKLQENQCFSRPKGISILNLGTSVIINYALF